MTIPETRLKLELLKPHTLPEIERMILSLSTTSEKYLDVWLTSDLGTQLFKDNLIVGLLVCRKAWDKCQSTQIRFQLRVIRECRNALEPRSRVCCS